MRVALVEAGGTPPPHEAMPAAVASLQLDPAVDWMYTGDPGGAGRGLTDGRMMVPRGKMLGGSSGLNYMAYVRGHPGDFDALGGRGRQGLGVRRRAAVLREERGPGAAGPARGRRDRRGRARHRRPAGGLGAGAADGRRRAVRRGGRGGRHPRPGTTTAATAVAPAGLASLFQTTTREGKRSSTYHAFLEPVAGPAQPDRDHPRPGREGAARDRRRGSRGPPACATAPRTARPGPCTPSARWW